MKRLITAILLCLLFGQAHAAYVSLDFNATAFAAGTLRGDYQEINTGQLQQPSVSQGITATVTNIYGNAQATVWAEAAFGALRGYANADAFEDGGATAQARYDINSSTGGGASWGDKITITTGGTFTITATLTSQVSGAPLQGYDPLADPGVHDFSGAYLDTWVTTTGSQTGNIFNANMKDGVGDGNQGPQTFTFSVQTTLAAGTELDVIQTLDLSLLGNGVNGAGSSASIDAMNTGVFTLDPLTSGAAYTTESGVSYLSAAIPVPAAIWYFGSAISLLGWMRRKAS